MDSDPITDYIPEVAFRLREESIGGDRLVMALEGELDMFVAPSLVARFHEIAEDGSKDVVVDLSDARFIDTTVLEAFVTAQKELQDHKHALAVVAPAPYTRRTFELTGLNELLRVAGSRDEAIGRLAV